MITLKPNTYYKTRDGRKAFIGFKLPPTKEPKDDWCGYIIPHPESWAYYWSDNGRFELNGESELDLVAEWTETKLRPWEHKEVPLGAWMREKTVGLPSLIVAITIGGLWRGHGDAITFDYALAHYEHSTDGGKTWLPCGVME